MVQFAEPPTTRGGRTESPRNIEIAKALKQKPGAWALVAEAVNNDGLAVRIRTGKAKSFAVGTWEATSRGNEDGTFNIYARFVDEA